MIFLFNVKTGSLKSLNGFSNSAIFADGRHYATSERLKRFSMNTFDRNFGEKVLFETR